MITDFVKLKKIAETVLRYFPENHQSHETGDLLNTYIFYCEAHLDDYRITSPSNPRAAKLLLFLLHDLFVSMGAIKNELTNALVELLQIEKTDDVVVGAESVLKKESLTKDKVVKELRPLIKETIGEGKFGVVKKVRFGQSRLAAKFDKYDDNVVYEINQLQKLSHPNIVRVVMAHSNPSTMFMPYYSMTLARFVHDGGYNELTAVNILIQVASGLAYLHDNNVLHLDIKVLNILLRPFPRDKTNQLSAVIADFGNSIIGKRDDNDVITIKLSNGRGSVGWIAPEIFNYTGILTDRADVWSFGLVMHTVKFGKLYCSSWNLIDVKTSYQKYPHGKNLIEMLPNDGIRKLVTPIFSAITPAARPSASKVLSGLVRYRNSILARSPKTVVSDTTICDFRQ